MPAWFWVGSPRPWSRIIVGCDHAGWELKQGLLAQWRRMAMEVKDMGTHSPEPCHYGEIAARVVPEVLRHWPTALGCLSAALGKEWPWLPIGGLGRGLPWFGTKPWLDGLELTTMLSFYACPDDC